VAELALEPKLIVEVALLIFARLIDLLVEFQESLALGLVPPQLAGVQYLPR